MPLEPGIIAFSGQIVRKVQINHSLLQIAGIIYIDDIGVFLAKPFIHRQTCPWSNSMADSGLKFTSINSEYRKSV